MPDFTDLSRRELCVRLQYDGLALAIVLSLFRPCV
jgi:hypothetical protein